MKLHKYPKAQYLCWYLISLILWFKPTKGYLDKTYSNTCGWTFVNLDGSKCRSRIGNSVFTFNEEQMEKVQKSQEYIKLKFYPDFYEYWN